MDAEDARRLAPHALALFAAALALLVTAAGATYTVVVRRAAQRAAAATPRARRVGPLALAGLALLAAAVALFALLAIGAGPGGSVGRFDDAFSDGLVATTPPAALQAFAAITRLGNTATLTTVGIVVFALLLATRRVALAFVWAAGVGGNAVLNVTLKALFERIRPDHAGGIVVADGFSFPSGHASGSVVAWGLLAWLALRLGRPSWRLPALLVAVAAAFAVGCSRVFLRVHYPSDVLAGFASGGLWLALCIAAGEAWRRRAADTIARVATPAA